MSSNGEYEVNVDQIGQFIRHNSCPRRFRLEYNDRELAKEPPFSEDLFDPIDPILQKKGRLKEEEWESRIEAEGFQQVQFRPDGSEESVDGQAARGESEDEDGTDASWEDFKTELEGLSVGQNYYAREVPVSGVLGVIGIEGKMDFLLIRWEDGTPTIRVIEVKASRKDKTYHRIQVATYKLLVEQRLSGGGTAIAGHQLNDTDVEAVVGRIDESTNQVQDVLAMDSFDLTEEMSDIRQLTEADGKLSAILETDLEELDYHLNSKCDSCVFDVHCYPESARRDRLEILGLNPSEAKALRREGIENVEQLAQLSLDSDAAHRVRQRDTFTSELQSLKERAQARRQNLPKDSPSDEYPVTPYTHDGNSQLPSHEIRGQRTVRVYLNVDYDYTEDRVAALSAHVTSSQGNLTTEFERSGDGWEPSPEVKEDHNGSIRDLRGGDITTYRNREWVGNYDHDTGAEEDLINGFFRDLISEILTVADGDEAPIHFYVWSESEIEHLMDACSRSGADTLSQFRALLGCREPTEQLIYSSLREEVDSRYGLGWTGRGLSVVTSLPWFGDRYHWVRSIHGERVDLEDKFSENLFDFKTNLYLDSDNAWTGEDDPQGESEKFEIRSRFYDSLPVPYLHAEWGTLPDPDEADDYRMERALENYQEATDIDHLETYLQSRARALRWIDEKINFYNDSIQKPILNIRGLTDYSLDVENAAEAALDFLLLDHHSALREYLSSGLQPPSHRVPSGTTLPLADVVVGPDGVLRGKIDVSEHDIDIETLRDRCSFEEDSFVRISPCAADPQRGQTVSQLLDAGRTCVIQSVDWESHKIELDVITKYGYSDSLPDYRLNSYSVSAGDDLFDTATLDDSVSGYVKNRVHRKIVDERGNYVHRWFDPENPEIPEFENQDTADVEDISEILQDFTVGGDDELHSSQIECIEESYETRTHLIHGPPGTGKTTTISLAGLARTLQDLEAGTVVYVGGNTHTAVSNLIDRMAGHASQFTDLAQSVGLEPPETEFVRIDSDHREISTASSVNLIESKSCVRKMDNLRDGSVVFVSGTVNQLLKMDSTLSGSVTFGGDAESFHSPLLIVDEASMMVFPDFLALAELVEDDTGRIILSGDHKQLPPIVEHDWEDEDRPPVEKYQPYNSAFEAVRNLKSAPNIDASQIQMSALEQSFRLPPAINSLIGKIYDEQAGIDLQSREASDRTQAITGISTPEDLTQLWNQPSGLYLLVHDESESRQCNPTEADIIGELLGASNSLSDDTVSVLTPHRAQRAQLERRLEGTRNQDAIDIIDTVERMQGGECENIIVSATASDQSVISQNDEFLLNLNRANVAFSRAKSRLFVVCSRELLDYIPPELEEYQSAVLWKTLRNRCDKDLGHIEIDDTEVDIRGPGPEMG